MQCKNIYTLYYYVSYIIGNQAQKTLVEISQKFDDSTFEGLF